MFAAHYPSSVSIMLSKQKQIWCGFTNRSRIYSYTTTDLPYDFNYRVAELIDEGIALISQKITSRRAFDGECILGLFFV